MNVPLPVLMDGDLAIQQAKQRLPLDSCPEQWLLEHPKIFTDLAMQYAEAGSSIVCTPTDRADRSHLEVYGLEKQTAKINAELTRFTVAACKEQNSNIVVAGSLSPLTLYAQPFGETPFLDIVNIYAEQALALKYGGADLLLADNMISLSHCRAAILGCKQSGLPVMVILDVEPDGETHLGCDLVAALIVCQSLGADAFGLTCRDGLEHLVEHVEEMAPYATIPLIAKPDAEQYDPKTWAKAMLRLYQSGVQILGGGKGVSPAYIAALKQELQENSLRQKTVALDTDSIFMAGETEPYFLDEFFEQSEPMICSFDMADELLAAEDAPFDVITVQIDSLEDAWNFAENCHMLHKPVSFLSDNEEALEMALLMFNGRAFVDSRSNLNEEVLRSIASGYGAIIR